ncbi:unnamed protein product [Urochloa decumbens]|uniref:Protein kinase domain-containing protein n=1 Tax=Urochloa decumbens TaxID=240449 RepID=A0ABC9DJ02_9POAL
MVPVLSKLNLLLAPESRLRKQVKDGIRLLKEDLEEVSSALVDLSMLETPSLRAKCWMEEARELSYHMEDFVDDMLMRRDGDAKTRPVCRHRVGRVKIAQLPKPPRRSTRIAKISQLRAQVWQASERHERYQLDACCSSNDHMLTRHGRAPALHRDAANIVGIEDSRIKLIEVLNVEAEQHLKVISIVGPAGVGKTTLAKEIFRELRGQFELRAFVCVSRKIDMRRLLGSILCQVQPHRKLSSVAGPMQNLIDNIQEQLQDKRYLIVIDDLWEEMAWDILRGAFPEGNSCSRIVSTTENMNVARRCCGYIPNHIFKMKPLGIQDSGTLFFSRIFGSEQQCPDELKEVSYGIIRKCGGHPLALINLAGLLASQLNYSELWYHVHDRLCSILNRNHTVEEIQKQILNLCYSSLPDCLKTCLLYFNMYPEGYIMWKDHLVKQWIAEGFVNAAEGKDREKIAEGYFDELVNRGMIQSMKINCNDEASSFTVHHIILDLITHNSKQDGFIGAIDCSQTITGLSTKAHRLSIQSSSAKYAKQPARISMLQLRSLGFFGLLKCMPSIVEFKNLRVLILDCWGNHDGHMSLNLSRICILFQLKYLKISSDIMVELPAKMQGLHYLEILEIDARISAVPLDIVRLPSLLHLGLQDATKLPHGIGRIKSLNSLWYFDLRCNSEANIRSLGKLTNLCHLHLTCSAALSSDHLKRKLIPLVSSLRKFGNLKSLTLTPDGLRAAIFFDISSDISFPSIFLQRLELLPPICLFSTLPTGIGELHKLRIFKIVVKELQGNDIRNIARLPSLVVFSLYVRKALTGTVIFTTMSFPALKYFKFTCGVMCLAFQPGAMPNLQRLKLCFNAHRGENHSLVLNGIEHLLNLQEVAGRIGVLPGSDESNMRVLKLSFEDTIKKHPRRPRFNLQLVDFIEEEYPPFDKLHWTQQQEGSSGQHEIIEKDCAEDMNKQGNCRLSRAFDLPPDSRSSYHLKSDEDSKHHMPVSMLRDESAEPSALDLSHSVQDDMTRPAWDTVMSFAPTDIFCQDLSCYSDKEMFVTEDIFTFNGTGTYCSLTMSDDDTSSTTTEAKTISPDDRFKPKIKSWIRGAHLGHGSFGWVYEGISDEGYFFAVKELSSLDQGSDVQQCILALEQEIELLSQFEHKNIVQYYGTDKEESKLYIFVELITQGSLLSLYQKHRLRESQVSAYTRQILNGLVYLHEQNVVHGLLMLTGSTGLQLIYGALAAPCWKC